MSSGVPTKERAAIIERLAHLQARTVICLLSDGSGMAGSLA